MTFVKRQHYVQRAYLENWCVKGRMSVRIGGKILSQQSPAKFCVQSYMYGFVDLTAAELAHLCDVVVEIAGANHCVVASLLNPICLNVLRFRCEKGDFTSEYVKIFDSIEKMAWYRPNEYALYKKLRLHVEGIHFLTNDELQTMDKIAAIGFEEYECTIEKYGFPIIKRIIQTASLSELMDEHKSFQLLLYIANQIVRGPDYLKRLEVGFSDESRKSGGSANLGNYIRYFLPLWVAEMLYNKRHEYKCVLLSNRTGIEFITSDAPVVCFESERITDAKMLYFPLSPSCGLLYGERKKIALFTDKYTRDLRDCAAVEWLNLQIVETHNKALFATTPAALEKYVNS